MRLKQISLKGVNSFLEKAYLPVLAVVLIILLVCGATICYKYVYRTTKAEPDSEVLAEDINQEGLQKILKGLDTREESLKRIWKGYYLDPFN